jgi:sterol desaturase/sphingolipid hydroxylase (fatty acid hydroxylase superfamily)
MKPEIIIIFLIFFAFILAEIIFTRFFKKSEQVRSDGIVEAVSTLMLLLFTSPKILVLAYGLCLAFLPQYQNALLGINAFLGFGLFLLLDDLTQYGWHRLSHSVPWLYKLHRPHHNARYMSIRLVYRNNLFYYALMPGIWLSGILIYLGLGGIYAVYIVLKLIIIYGAHSDIPWDRPLYKIKWLSPIMWVVERLISTPSTHHAHHGRHGADGITHYKGNYGNMLFLWDVIFGTAKITRNYPQEFGVENLPETSLGEQLIWPIIRKKS